MKLRHHQEICMNNIDKHFKENESKALIKMFCGSGKSFIIYNCLLKYGNNLSVVVVPSINLITQFNRDYLLNEDKKKYNKKHFKKEFELITICSKNELETSKTKINFTTDEDDILEFLLKEEDKIILITYQSLEILTKIVQENDLKIDLLCFDEAHHIFGDGKKKLLFGINEDDNSDIDEYSENFIDSYVDKTLFFTATPKNSNGIMMYEPNNAININDEDFEIVDDEDTYIQEEPDCGKMIFEYMHLNGVNDNVLNDFNVRVDLYTENNDKSVFEAISRSILETGNNRVLTFHSRSETKSEKGSDVLSFTDSENNKQFQKCFTKVLKKEFPKLKDKYKNIHFKGITANTKNKTEILYEFDKTPDDEIYILASCKTIGEGVDTKNANMVVFVDPKQSYIEIVQNIGRVCRKNENTKQLATVLIPCYVDINKYKDCKTSEEKDKVIREEMSKTGNFNGILNVLSALRQEDPYLFELCLRYPETYTEKEINDNLKKNGLEYDKREYKKEELFKEYKVKYDDKKSEEENFKKLADKTEKNIQVINNKVLDDDIYVDNESEETLYFVKKDNDTYVKTKGETKEKKINKCNRNIKPFVHANDEIQVLWGIVGEIDLSKKVFGGYIKATVIPSSEEKWEEMLNKVKKYIDENGKRPTIYEKNLEVKKLGSWLSNQIQNYNKKNKIMKNAKIFKKWENFVCEYKNYFLDRNELWEKTLKEVSKFIIENNKRPSKRDSNYKIKKLALWISHNKTNYDKKIQIMSDLKIRKKWEEFISNNNKYFMDNNEEWLNTFKKLKDYMNENNKRPSSKDKNLEIKKLGIWLTRQQRIYKSKINIMSNIYIRDKWTEFINDYNNLLITKEELWKLNLNKTINYIKKYNNKPLTNDSNENFKRLGQWLSRQQINYKNNEDLMKNSSIKILWEKFIDDNKKYFFNNNEIWEHNLSKLKEYIKINKIRPSQHSKNLDDKFIGSWSSTQVKNYKNLKCTMKEPEIRSKWEEFITEYQQYFPDNQAIQKQPVKKSTTIKPKEENKPKETEKEKKQRILSEYQELTKKMSTQKSDTTRKMFKENYDLWYKYHDNRDFSFKGYDNQDEIPLNKIINYIETKSNRRLKILDLGCGRNLIKQHFKENRKLEITGYDYVSYNESKVCDISQLPNEDESVDICVFSQSLMGTNWKEYINEANRVLRYNGEMIISESKERYELIKEYIESLELHIKLDDYNETKRWFFLHVINDKINNESTYNKKIKVKM